MLAHTMDQMKQDGVRRALAFVTSAFSSYSGCRQYRENLIAAQNLVGSEAPIVDKLRVYYNHPGFIDPMVENVRAALEQLPEASLIFTAHSVPQSMADTSRYVSQLKEASRLIAERAGVHDYALVFQSRSGPPEQPWLEPDIGHYLRELQGAGVKDAIVTPVGFISDHMEVLYDLDTEAAGLSKELGMRMVRASTVGAHPKFVRMIRDLVMERLDPAYPKQALGLHGPSHDVCPSDCCPAPQRPAATVPAV